MSPKPAGPAAVGNSSSQSTLIHSYFFYSALLAVKFVCLKPLASIVCCPQKVLQASLSDLKYLTPFWVVAGVYITTSPDEDTAKALLRTYAIARFIAAYGYVYRAPEGAKQTAFLLSMAVSCYMAACVVYHYRPMM